VTTIWSFLTSAMRAVAVVYSVALVAGCQADPGHGGRASREWIEQLRQGDAKEREDAAVALGNVLAVNPKLERPVTALVAALADTIDAVRVAASSALAQPGVIAMDALPGLAQMLNDSSHASVRAQGVRAIGRLLSTSALAERAMLLGSVVPAHRDGDAAVRAAVADALGRIMSSATTDTIVQQTLETLVRDSVASTRLRAVEALGSLPAMARRQALHTALNDSSAAVRHAAVLQVRRDTLALADMQAQLVNLLADSSAPVRLAAVRALGSLSMATYPNVTAALRARLTDADSTVRTEASHALTRFHAQGGRDASHEPTLLERCKQLPPRTRGC
jgi:HEAT repeat protein